MSKLKDMYWMNCTSMRENVVWMMRRWVYWSEGLLLVWMREMMSMTDWSICRMGCYGLGDVGSESSLRVGFLRDGFYYESTGLLGDSLSLVID